ncbi:ubiquitin carboxyl-terminal hydrolase 24-like protein [Trifolium pratense]|uniref:Ubiquitin carboxyl-terminal hydrolase 24-like protein n=1 Tax=Trifolium pratense TaxID=57577 RepID=A0A2K3NJS2_TRIPR|nr:ubiquitin carboxyl-terminal hydrolase 24-like protein [Trifolium pratense]
MGDSRLKLVKTKCSFQMPRICCSKDQLVFNCQTFLKTGRKYELVATITHHGREPSKGHYTADAQYPNGQWLRFDDASVFAIGANKFLFDGLLLTSRPNSGLLGPPSPRNWRHGEVMDPLFFASAYASIAGYENE